MEIDANLRSARQKLLENFDTEVAEKLHVYKKEATASLNRYESLLWDTSCYMLDEQAVFDETSLTFKLTQSPIPEASEGNYTLKRQDSIGHHYRLQHPLAQSLLAQAKELPTEDAELTFDYTGASVNISIVETLIGKAGTLTIRVLSVTALETEDYILAIAITDDGQEIDAEATRRLFNLLASISFASGVSEEGINVVYQERKKQLLENISERNATFFEEEMEKLDRWADDQKRSLEIQVKEFDIEIKQLKTEFRKIAKLEDKITQQRKIKNMDRKRTELRRKLFDAQDEIDRQKDSLLVVSTKQSITYNIFVFIVGPPLVGVPLIAESTDKASNKFEPYKYNLIT